MKKKLLLALCLMASLAGYAQWWSGHAENVVFDEDARTMTITGLQAGHLGDIIVEDYGSEHTNLREAPWTWANELTEGYRWFIDYQPAPIETLIITGNLNGEDMKIIADMGRDWRDGTKDPTTNTSTPPDSDNDPAQNPTFKRGGLKNLDISGANIVAGGTYFQISSGVYDGLNRNQIEIGGDKLAGAQELTSGATFTKDAENNKIGDYMFVGCNVLESIKLPINITEIGSSAFSLMQHFDEIKIPASVEKIKSYAFWLAFNMDRVRDDPKWAISPVPSTTIIFEGLEDMVELEQYALEQYNRSGSGMAMVIMSVQTPLALLGDYAVEKGEDTELMLKDNIENGALKATATPPNKYWTFSCGVDIVLPENIKAYTCRIVNGETDIVELTNAQLDADEDGKRVIPANNGVLLACPDNAESNAYDMVVQYNEGITAIATEDAKTWGDQNALVPVIRKAHYNPGDYYMLYHGKWVVLASDAEQVPAGKALLKK